MSDEARSGTQHSAGKNEKTAPRPANIPASLSGCRSEHAFHISRRPAPPARLLAHRPAGFGAFRPPSKKSIALLTTAGNNGILKKIGNYQQKVR